jgi:hypothetical protein
MAERKKRKPIDPETRAQWIEARAELEAALARSRARTEAFRAREARRRERLRRWTFGLLGREEQHVSG